MHAEAALALLICPTNSAVPTGIHIILLLLPLLLMEAEVYLPLFINVLLAQGCALPPRPIEWPQNFVTAIIQGFKIVLIGNNASLAKLG